MKNILKLSFVALITLVAVSCKKDYNQVSKVVTPSYPKINFPNGKFFSIKVGDPTPQIVANAYDSLLKQAMGVTYDPSVIDNTKPGLYVVPITSEKNVNGYFSADAAYVAVTNIDTAVNISGNYLRAATGVTAKVTKIKNGLYSTDQLGGAATLPVLAYFCQIDSTTLDIPVQPTSNVGDVYCTGVSLSKTSPLTMIYVVRNPYFATAPRTFVKQ